jgi:O-antigen/teichoic acid export membrane protein
MCCNWLENRRLSGPDGELLAARWSRDLSGPVNEAIQVADSGRLAAGTGAWEKGQSLTMQAFWLLAAKVVGFGISFALPLVLVRVLNQLQFGLYKQSFLVAATAQSILPLGFGLSAFYFLPREGDRKGRIVLNIAMFNALVGLAGFLALAAYPKILVLVFGGVELVTYAPLIGLVILLGIFSSFLEIVATAHQEVRYSAIFIVAAQFTKSLFMLGAAAWFSTLRALLVAAVLQGLVQSAILLWYLRSRFPGFWSALDWGLLRTQFSYAMPLGVAGLIYALRTDLHNYFVSHTFGPSAFAVYAVGCFQVPLVGLLLESVSAVLLSRISYLQQQGERREILLLTMRVMRKLAAIYWPIYAFLLVIGRELLVVLFTAQYRESWPIFAINLTLLPLAVAVHDPIVRAFAERRYLFLGLRVTSLLVLLGSLWLGIRGLGMLGAICAVVAVAFVERVAIGWIVVVTLGMKLADLRHLRDMIKLGAVAGGAGFLAALVRLLLIRQPALLILTSCGVVFLLAYCAGIVGLRVLTTEESQALRRHWRRLCGVLAVRLIRNRDKKIEF